MGKTWPTAEEGQELEQYADVPPGHKQEICAPRTRGWERLPGFKHILCPYGTYHSFNHIQGVSAKMQINFNLNYLNNYKIKENLIWMHNALL